jgi:pimeloyl-ACP methyl ester carboxylesterase
LKTDQLSWTWNGAAIRVGFDCLGEGPTLLLLPALSSISTRLEMRPLQERLASSFATFAVDRPGFGDLPRPSLHWQPAAYLNFLRELLALLGLRPIATIAAGHAASYAISVAADAPSSLGRLCLIAPTWRGPLPTILPGHRGIGAWITRLGDVSGVGALLYRLNVNAPVVRMMARGHVYSNPHWLEDERFQQKMAVTKASGARFGSIRFVTGMLDLFTDRAAFIDVAKRIKDPMLVIYGAATPRRSKAEMEILGSLPQVEAVELPQGKLAVHEEFPEAVAETVLAFLNAAP